MLASCTEAKIDHTPQADSSSGSPLSIEVSTAADSRVTVTDQWTMAWEEGDALLGYSAGASTFEKFSMTKFEGSAASFSGGDIAHSYRLIYPYDSTVSEPTYTIDLSEQKAGIESTYMISEGKVSEDTPKAAMKHIGAMMTLKVLGCDALAGYKLKAVEIEGVPTTAEIDLSGDIAIDPTSGTYGSTNADVPMKINIDEDIIVTAGTTPELRFNILPFTIAQDQTISAKITFVNNNGYEHIVSASVTNTKGRDITFSRAKYHTLGVTLDEEEINDALLTPTWDNEYYQYVSPVGTTRVNIVDDYGAPTDGVSNSSAALQAAIDYISSIGGGEIYIPAGQFCFKTISMRSNVTILVEAGATIKPMYPADPESTTVTQVFYFYNTDGSGAPLENVEMIGLGGRFNVVLERRVNQTLSAKLFLLGSIKNFRISNVNITDVDTSYPMFTFNPTAIDSIDPEDGKKMMGAKNGIISHARVDNCHYGYGLVQIQAGENIHFEKLSGVGGVTLRAETGAQSMNNSQWGGVFNITGKDIYCKNGNAAAMVSPHGMQNGDVSIEHIIAESCGMGVRLDGGYISDKDDEGLVSEPGSYQNVKISKVYARFGWEAQLKSKHYGYLPDELHQYCPPTVNNVSEPAPSIAAVVRSMRVEDGDAKTLVIEDVVAIGYITPPVLSCSWEEYLEDLAKRDSTIETFEEGESLF